MTLSILPKFVKLTLVSFKWSGENCILNSFGRENYWVVGIPPLRFQVFIGHLEMFSENKNCINYFTQILIYIKGLSRTC